MHVVLAGGGTAGHIEPALNTADEIRRSHPQVSISVLGTNKGLETRLVPERGYDLTLIPPVPLPRRLNLDLLTLAWRLRTSVSAVREHLRQTEASVVVGFGGYVALPAYLAARSMRIPIVVHEANAKAGLANRVGARFAACVIETVRGSLPSALFLGLPLRSTIANLAKSDLQSEAYRYWGLTPERKTLLVFGGSLGARSLNPLVQEVAKRLAASGYQVLHSVGSANLDQLCTDVEHYLTVPYIDRMDLAYSVASAAVCRAGAMTVAELTAVGIPAVYVPLPIGNGEQKFNALPVAQSGGGVVVDQSEFKVDAVVEIISSWFSDADEKAAKSAASCGRADAASSIVEEILKVAEGK